MHHTLRKKLLTYLSKSHVQSETCVELRGTSVSVSTYAQVVAFLCDSPRCAVVNPPVRLYIYNCNYIYKYQYMYIHVYLRMHG